MSLKPDAVFHTTALSRQPGFFFFPVTASYFFIFQLFRATCHLHVYLLVVAVSQDPVLLLGVKKQAEDIKGQAVFLVGCPLVKANEQAALHLRVGE